MQTPNKLVDKIGATVIDHSAYLVRTGMWIGAVAFFTEQLGWKIVREAGNIDGAGWRAIFLAVKEGDPVTIQLTEEIDHPDTPVVFEGVHLGLKVRDAKQAAAEIQYRYQRQIGLTCEIKQADDKGLKWFVVIPDLFTFALELITTADAFNWQREAQRDLVCPPARP